MNRQFYNGQQQSQIINQKFRALIQSKDQSQSGNEHKFSQQQVQLIGKRFDQLCHSRTMTYDQFRRGLGLLGRQQSFICRIFYLIDQDGDGNITQQNYINYLSIILKGTQLQKARFGWMIFTQNKGDMQLKDFMQLFQQISVVWNALTGQIVTPKKKYIEELFNTFDVDQDQIITFEELFYSQHLQLSGWFQYFNNVQLQQEVARNQLQKVRQKLRKKLSLEPANETPLQDLKMRIKDHQLIIQRKVHQLTENMQQCSSLIIKHINSPKPKQKQKIIYDYQEDRSVFDFGASSMLKSNFSNPTTNDEVSQQSIKSLYRYSRTNYDNQINKMQSRKQQYIKQRQYSYNTELSKQLYGFLMQTKKIMQICESYKQLKQQQRKYSPTKLKQMQVKLSLFDKQIQHQQNNKQNGQKMIVYFGHQNWNMAVNIMVGMRMSLKYLLSLNRSIVIQSRHFTQKHAFLLGNKAFMSGKGPEALKKIQHFQFVQLAPLVFERMRQSYGISNNQYQRSVGPQSLLNQLLTGDLTSLNQKCSTGKSGAFFYLTPDNKIFLKTLPKRQYQFFMSILPNYYQFIINNPNTLTVRILGFYKLKIYVAKQKINTVYFISMQNIFYQVKQNKKLKITEVYDLKGSLYDRKGKQGKQLKDQDWLKNQMKIKLPPEVIQQFKSQIYHDSRFFKKNNINDYSLIVALVRYDEKDLIYSKKQKNIFKNYFGGIKSKQPGLFYILSIIDFLTVFQLRKNLQYIFKTTFLSKYVSCVPPSDYCQRFRNFILTSLQ